MPRTSVQQSPPRYANLHRSLQQRVGAAGLRHVLNTNTSWDTLFNEATGNYLSREDKARGMVCRVKPTYSSYVDLLNLTLSDTDSELSTHSVHSQHDEDPLRALLLELNVETVNWDAVEILENDLNLYVPINNDNSNHVSPIPSLPDVPVPISPLSSRGSSIDTLILRNDDQILIDINNHQRLIDNPREMWWVSDPPHSSNDSSKESSNEEEEEQQQDNEDNESSITDTTTTTHHSSIVRTVQPIVLTGKEKREINSIEKYLDFRQKRTGQIDINNMSPLEIGNIPNIVTSDHVTKIALSKKGAKIWLPKDIQCNKYTPKKNLPFLLRMVRAGILEETKNKPKHTILMFAVPKSDPLNPRMILDLNLLLRNPSLLNSNFLTLLNLLTWQIKKTI